ncbi:MAG: FG-GAP repeat domain-containing protein, partial [Bacteroidota bacterium]
VTFLAGVSTNQWITGATVVDINGDQMPDVYLSVSGNQKAENRKNLLFVHQGLENGVPSFIEKAAEYGIADTGYATQSVFFDADLDGDLDLYILNHGNEREKVNTPLPEEKGAPESDKFYVNNGDGSFSDISEKAGISDMAYGLGIAIADVNSDGLPDIFVANDFIANDKLYINQGNLSFNDEVDNYLPYQSYNSMGCDFGDMDNDGFPELWVLDMLPSNMNDFRQMAGSMTSFKWEYMLKMGYSPQYMRNTFYQHKGIIPNENAFVFQESARQKSVEATDWSWAVLMADFNMDGLKDGVVTNGYFRDITDIDFIQFSKSFAAFKNLKNANITLLNEIRKRPSLSAENNLFLQSESGVFNRSSLINNNEPDCSQGMAYADFDLDGDLDVAINHLNKPASILENKSNLQKDFNFLQIKLKG